MVKRNGEMTFYKQSQLFQNVNTSSMLELVGRISGSTLRFGQAFIRVAPLKKLDIPLPCLQK